MKPSLSGSFIAAAHSSWEGVQGMGASSRAAAWLTSIHLASTSPALPAPHTRSALRPGCPVSGRLGRFQVLPGKHDQGHLSPAERS
jgi:hypothetical protein